MSPKFSFWSKKRGGSAVSFDADVSPAAEMLKNKKELDKKLVYSLNAKKIPSLKQLKYLFAVLNRRQKWLMVGLTALIMLSVATIAGNFYVTNFIPTPTIGGTYTEGLIGAPQYINSLLSQTNDVDADLSRLVYSGLFKYDENLQLVEDLAQEWSVNPEETEYTFTLKEGVSWHDGQPLTASDVVFTFESAKDVEFKSPLFVSVRGIEVEQVDDVTVVFRLPQPYPGFLELMTTGILPEHIWAEIPAINANLAEYNLKPVGTGPWKFESRLDDKSLGNVRSMTFTRNENFYGPKPYIEKLVFKFYPDFQTAIGAMKNQSIDGISYLPKELKSEITGRKNSNFYSFGLPQYTAVFFNSGKNEVLKEKNIRKALALAIDKPKLLSDALQLEGEIIDAPLLPIAVDTTAAKIEYNKNQAIQMLDEAGWEQITKEAYLKQLSAPSGDVSTTTAETATTTLETNPAIEEITDSPQQLYRIKDDKVLEVTITTVNQPENNKAALIIQKFWQDIGVKATVQVVEGSKISREVIKPRNYEILLFGIIVGSNPDPFPFWHSSQVADPGLNLSLFSNRQADKTLEDARTLEDPEKIKEQYQKFIEIIGAEIPAIFLYKPTYTYVVNDKVKGISLERITIPSDRFINSENWYIKTDRRYKGSVK